MQESSDITQTQSDDFWARHPQPEIHMSGEGASYQAETLMQPVPSETGTKENRNTGSAVGETMEPERACAKRSDGSVKQKESSSHRSAG
ncbi:MAG: hypothetical protein ACLUD0_18745 [Eubacterium ramulus]